MARASLWCVPAIATAFALSAGSALAEPRIEWEVVNRFPLFSDAAQFQAIAGVFDGLSQDKRARDPVLNLEIELQRRAAAKTLGPAFDDPAALSRNGWSSAVVRKTCYDSGSRSYAGCRTSGGGNYLTMKTADVSARLVDGPTSGVCRWSLNGSEVASRPCDGAPVTLPGAPIGDPFYISVTADAGPVASVAGERIRPLTIVGLGDSFASGEGNPDRPADFDVTHINYGRTSVARRVIDKTGSIPIILHDRDFQRYPLRKEASPTAFGAKTAEPVWFNGQCHRSLYSHQLKAALQVALENRRALVKYFAYACTGAEIYEGVLGYWGARSDAVHPDSTPQLVKLLRDHCGSSANYVYKPGVPKTFDWRTIKPCASAAGSIDAVLLSIGGNDVGFASVIAHDFFWPENGQGGFKTKFKLWKKFAGPIPFSEAHLRLPSLRPRFAELKEALRSKAGVPVSKVIQIGYPQLAKVSKTTTCGKGRDGMDVHQIFGINHARTGDEAVRFVTALNSKIRDETDWTVLEGHIGKFDGHALCAGGMADGSSEPDGMRFPDVIDGRWKPFHPALWQPYRPRNRWFVTPNDSFLAGNYMTLKAPANGIVRDILQPLIAANYGGAFHPNPLGHAAMADTVADELRGRLGLAGLVAAGPVP